MLRRTFSRNVFQTNSAGLHGGKSVRRIFAVYHVKSNLFFWERAVHEDEQNTLFETSSNRFSEPPLPNQTEIKFHVVLPQTCALYICPLSKLPFHLWLQWSGEGYSIVSQGSLPWMLLSRDSQIVSQTQGWPDFMTANVCNNSKQFTYGWIVHTSPKQPPTMSFITEYCNGKPWESILILLLSPRASHVLRPLKFPTTCVVTRDGSKVECLSEITASSQLLFSIRALTQRGSKWH